MKRTADATQIIAIGKLIDEHFDKEHMKYKDEWSDERVASEAKCKVSSVAGVRKQLGLYLQSGRPERIDLRAKIEEQQALINKLMLAHNNMAVILIAVGKRAMGSANFTEVVRNTKNKFNSDIIEGMMK